MNLLEEIKIKIQSGAQSDDEAIALSKQFAELRNHPPVIKKEEPDASAVL